jgi:hypothetical protein
VDLTVVQAGTGTRSVSLHPGQRLLVKMVGDNWLAPVSYDSALRRTAAAATGTQACALFEAVAAGTAHVRTTNPGACGDPEVGTPCGLPVHSFSLVVTVSA